jgi:hypothetical protein
LATDVQREELDRLGCSWTDDPQYSIDNCSKDRRVQVRDPKHYAPPSQVKKYVVKMAHKVFPPIIMTKDRWIVDGNTRVAARIARKEPYTSALILDEKWEGATEKRQKELQQLAGAINDAVGVGLTNSEIRDGVKRGLSLGWKFDEISRDTGATPATISNLKREMEADQKMDNLGISVKPSTAAKKALGRQDILKLNDEVYRSFTALAHDSGLPVAELDEIGRTLVKAGSDDEKLATLARLRSDMEAQIRDRNLYPPGKGASAPSRQLRQHLGFVVGYAGRESELIEVNLSKGEEYVGTVYAAITVLTTLANLQGVRNTEINRED